jgi:hypothetical protein
MRERGQASACGYTAFTGPLVEEAILSSMCVSGIFVKNQLVLGTWVISGIPVLFLSVFISVAL